MEEKEIIPKFLGDLQLSATLPQDMLNAQQQLISWCDNKIAILKSDAKDLKQAFEHAKKMKWKHTTLQNQYNKTGKRVSYYQKIKEALLAGYTIVPNFPVDIFAIRTDKDKPKQYLSTSSWERGRVSQPAYDMPLGVGEYKSDRPTIYEKEIGDNKKHYWAEKWQDVDFPLNMAKPIIMEATSNAMALKIFDRFGVFPSARKNDDPVIIGQIVHKQGAYQSKIVSFMIAWHLNTNVL